MAQPEFDVPDFLDGTSVDEIHQRMMGNLPGDIDDMPGGFPYDMTRPTAIEESEMLQFYAVRVLMLMFPQYAWDEYLDLHGKQVHLTRHAATAAEGYLTITGEPGTEIEAGTIFATPSTNTTDSIEYQTDEDCVIGENGTVTVKITALEEGSDGNVAADAITLMDDPDEGIEYITNPEPVTGGTDEETDDDFYDRVAAEYESSNTYLGNDADYIRWAKEAGAGDCIVDDAAEGPGTVKLILVDTNGQPADETLIQAVYNHIVSPDDRTRRLLPTACAKLICAAATTRVINFTVTGLLYDSTTDLEQIRLDFTKAAWKLFETEKEDNLVRYNDLRPLMSGIAGVLDFDEFLVDGDIRNIALGKEEYPAVGALDFS